MSQDTHPVEFYDDGLVHSHDWATCTPPGGHHAERRVRELESKPVREAA